MHTFFSISVVRHVLSVYNRIVVQHEYVFKSMQHVNRRPAAAVLQCDVQTGYAALGRKVLTFSISSTTSTDFISLCLKHVILLLLYQCIHIYDTTTRPEP